MKRKADRNLNRSRRGAAPGKPAVESHSSQVAVRPHALELPFHNWLLAALAALFVARTLVPSEGVAWVGDGQPFCMLWLLLALGTSLAAIKAGAFPRRLSAVDLAVIAFVVFYAIAAILGSDDGNPRAAMNLLWEVVAMGASYLLARQLVLTSGDARTLIVVMIVLAVVLSIFGLYQVFVSMPGDRAEFARDPDGMMRHAGQWYAKGTPERTAFENRLASTEPLATFALTNSLAGFLAAWFIVGVGLLRDQSSRQRWFTVGLLAVIAFCLLLTKSRSAYAATLVGLLLLAATRYAPRMQVFRVTVFAAAAAAVIAGAFFAGLIDSKVLTEAGKSLGYRAQYWQSSVQMIGDHPLRGVGPGNFQDYYTQYKLPEASEEIRDPHNWLIELAATAGIPTAIVFCLAIGLALSRLFRHETADLEEHVSAIRFNPFVLGGAAVGFVIAQVLGTIVELPLGFERIFLGVAMGAIVVWVLQGNSNPRGVSTVLLGTGAVVMLVHLLAAGGILYPSVAGSLWLMLALGMNASEQHLDSVNVLDCDSIPTPSNLVRAVPGIAFGTCAMLALAQYLTGYSPVLRSQGALLAAQDHTEDPRLYEAALIDAAAADPRAADPWQELSAFYLGQWLREPGPRTLGKFSGACKQFLARKPRSSSAHRLAGSWWQQVFAQSKNSQHAKESAAFLARAVELYPHLAILRAEYALSLLAAGNIQDARIQAANSLDVNRATPHADKQLPAEMRKKMQEIAAPTVPGSR